MRAGIWIGAGLLAGGLASLAGPALADPRLDEIVYSPYVEYHELELENRLGSEVGSGDLKGASTIVEEVEAGLTDRLSLALLTKIARDPGGGYRPTQVSLEGRYYIGQIPGIGIDVGAYLEAGKGLAGEQNGGEAKLLLAKTEGRFQGLFNFIVERPLGAPKGQGFASYGYAASATWRTVGNLRLGVEAFGDLGDDHGFLTGPQGAYLGPQVKWEGQPQGSPVEFEVDAGWLASVGTDRSEAPSQVRIDVEVERRF